MERNEFNERIQKEYDEFKESTLKLAPEEIFEKAFEIDFKTYFTSYLQLEESDISDETIENLNSIEGSILDALFEIYLNNDTYYTYGDMCEEILEVFDSEFYGDEEEIE